MAFQDPPRPSDTLQAQAGVGIGLGVLGLGGTFWGAVAAGLVVFALAAGSFTSASLGPGMSDVSVYISLVGAVLRVFFGGLLSLGAIAAGALLFMRGRANVLAFVAAGCVVYLVVMDALWPVVESIVSIVLLAIEMPEAALLGSVGLISTLFWVVVALGKAAFWGWTAYTAFQHNRAVAAADV